MTTPAEVTAPDRARWRVVWVAFVVAIFGWGIGFYGPALYLPTLQHDHGWSTSIVSTAVSAHFLLSAVLIACLPQVYRRFGVGRITAVGAVLTGLGAMAWANVHEAWQLVPALVLSGSGWAATSGAALNAIVAPWFDRDRPKAIGMAFNGASVGGVLFVPLWTLLISAFGLPRTGVMLGIAAVAVVCSLVRCFLWTAPDSIAIRTSPPAPMHYGQLIRLPRFTTISLAFAVALFAQIGLFAHLIARLMPDFGPSLAAAAISLTTLCAVLGRTLLGWSLGDRDRRLAAGANLLVQAVGSICLASGAGVAAVTIGCILFGLGVGNATTLPPLIAQREFRPVDVGSVVALVTAINQAVFSFAPAVFGWLRDSTGSYFVAFLMAGIVQVVAAAIIVAGRTARRDSR
jgi:MFS family permease